MLVVSGFRPVPGISDNRNVRMGKFKNKYNCKPVSFTSDLNETIIKNLINVIEEMFRAHGMLLGDNYIEKFKNPFEKLLKDKGLQIEFENIGKKTKVYGGQQLEFDNAWKAVLVNKKGERVLIKGNNESWGVTKGSAEFDLLSGLAEGTLRVSNIYIPQDLKEIDFQLKQTVLNRFINQLSRLHMRNPNDLNARNVQIALEILLPSEGNF